MDCPSCDRENPPDAFFCQSCDRFIPVPEKGKKANLLRRLVALAVDPLVAALLYFIAFSALDAIWEDSVRKLVAAVLPVLYFIWFLLLLEHGLTPGKKLLGLQVVKERTGKVPGFATMFLRDVVGRFLSCLVVGLGYLWALFDEDGQAWHDRLVGTVVLRRTVRAPPAGRPSLPENGG